MTINEKIISLLPKKSSCKDALACVVGYCHTCGENDMLEKITQIIQSLEFEVYEDCIVLKGEK